MRKQKPRASLLSMIGLLTAGALAQAAPVPETAPRNLVLIGVTQVGDRAQAWLMDVDSRTKETVSPGATAFGFRVKSVGPEQVVLTRGGRVYSLRLGERQVPTVAAAPVRTVAPTISGRIALPRRSTLPNVFAPPVFLTQDPNAGNEVEVQEPAPASAPDFYTDRNAPPSVDPRLLNMDPRLLNMDPRYLNMDPRLLPDIYPGYGAMAGYGMVPGYGSIPSYGAIPGYGMVPGYGALPGYGFDPQAAGYPAYVDETAGYPGALYASPGVLPGYPGYFGGASPDAYYPSGMTPFPSATAWGSPYAGYRPFVGNGLDLNAPRWSRQSGRRQNVDPFRGEITVNPQTQRRRARFSFPVQGQ